MGDASISSTSADEDHGADPNDSFDVVVPSLPGFGFADPGEEVGTIFRIGDIWHRLMAETLGYEQYATHGGDWGSLVTELIGRDHADSVVGIHLTDVPFYHAFRKPDDATAKEKKYLEGVEKFGQREGAYAFIQGAQPQALALGLHDSPAGLATWIIEKWRRWSDCDGDIESRFTTDELLSNVMIYWVTGTINTSFGPYSTPPREWAERFFNVQRWTEMRSGGHFAALEEPEALASDIREFFRPLRA